MTACDKCRKRMNITSTMVDFGEGLEELEIEYCRKCRTLFISAFEWTVIGV